MPAASSPLIRRSAAALLAASVVITLAACVDQGAAPQLTDEPARPMPTVTSDAPPTAPTAGADRLNISCPELVDPDAVYAFDPNYALLESWNPESGSAGAEALAAGGVACHWVRESGGGTIDLSVARLSESELTAKKNAAFTDSQMVPTYGDEAYFEVAGGFGTAIVFQGEFWLVISSEAFAEPGEPTEIIESALAALAAL